MISLLSQYSRFQWIHNDMQNVPYIMQYDVKTVTHKNYCVTFLKKINIVCQIQMNILYLIVKH